MSETWHEAVESMLRHGDEARPSARGTVPGAGPHIKKRVPSKRIKAMHRASAGFGSLLSLRAFVRGLADEAKLAKDWLANKAAV